jgi:hypothetical protein
MWRQGPTTSANDVICAARRGTFGSWSSPKLVSVPNMELFDSGIAFRGEEAVLVYTGAIGYGGGDPGLGVYQASHWPSFTTDPKPPIDLAEQGPRHSVNQVVGDNTGSVIAVETVWDGTTSRSYATAFDASPPEIIEAVVAATVNVGQVQQLRSKFADTWSPMGPVVWDFGDGTPLGTGPTVTHSWGAPGPYSVTLTGKDAQGNATTKTFQVTVT